MKSAIADYRYIVNAMRMTSPDGLIIRVVDYPIDLRIGGDIYKSGNGYQFTGIQSTSTMAASLIDTEGFFSDIGMTKPDVENGKWDGALVNVFATTWANPILDEEPLGKFIIGKIRIDDYKYSIEMMQLIDSLGQPTGRNVAPLCAWVLFDETIDGRPISNISSKCRLNIDDYKILDVAVTTIISSSEFFAGALTQPDDWFGAGWLQWVDGDNATLGPVGIKSFEAGVITLSDGMPYPILSGDTFDIIPGCRKRRIEDCIGKYDNAINHGGFDRVAPPSVYSKIGGQ